jgi:hypothetical protein
MQRTPAYTPDLLTYRVDDGRAGRGLGGVLALFGFVALGAGLIPFLEVPRYRDTYISGLSGVALGAALLGWGLYHVLRRSGLTFDRQRRRLINWVRLPWGVTRDECDLQPYDRVAVGRLRTRHSDGTASYEVYPVLLQGPGGERYQITPGTHDPEASRSLAAEIAEHLGLPVTDESGEEVESKKQ